MPEPDSSAPDDKMAEERVKRMMEPNSRSAPQSPADSAADDQGSSVLQPPVIETPENPASDDDVDKLLNGSGSVGADGKAEDAVVDDIVRNEGDEALEAQDKVARQNNVVMKPKLWERLKNDWSDWWDDPRKRYISLGVIGILLICVFLFPASRAFMLNLVGMRGTVTVQVLDSKTTLPLTGADVTISGQTAATNDQGKATVQHVKLGTQQLSVRKTAFADVNEPVTIKTGSQTVPNVSLKPTGMQFSFLVVDSLTGKPIASAEVASGSASALSDKAGKVLLTAPPTTNSRLDIAVSAKGYRTEKVKFRTDSKGATTVELIPAGKDVFVSKEAGKYDLYAADLDGKNRKVILAATGTETANLTLSVSPDGQKAALVSTRDNQKNAQGYLLSTLTIVNTDGSSSQTVEHAEDITLLGWSGTKLVYGQTVAGASAANPNRQKIIVYDTNGGKKLPLASANYFNGSELVGSNVYYAVASSDGGAAGSFNKIAVDGTGKQILANQEQWTVLRTAYDALNVQSASGAWQTYTIGGSLKPGTAPASLSDRVYADNSDASKSLWVDQRDGKGTLLSYDTKAKKDTTLTAQAGLTYPVRWMSDTTVVYRVATQKETADYVMSTAGGQPKKITDVTATSSTTQLR